MKFLFNLPLDTGRKIWGVREYLWQHARILAILCWIIFIIPLCILMPLLQCLAPFLGKYLSDQNRYFYEETDFGEEYCGGHEENYSPS